MSDETPVTDDLPMGPPAPNRGAELTGRLREAAGKRLTVAVHGPTLVRVLVAMLGLWAAVQGQLKLDQRDPRLLFDAWLFFGLAVVTWCYATGLGQKLIGPVTGPGKRGTRGQLPVGDEAATPAASEPSPAPEPLAVEQGPDLAGSRGWLLTIGLVWIILPAFVSPALFGAAAGAFNLLSYPDGLGRQTNSFMPLGTLLWLVGLVMVVLALADTTGWAERARSFVRRPQVNLQLDGTLLALLVITGIGAFYRFYDLAGVPLEMTSDHTEKLRDIDTILNGLRPVFLPGNGGREGMEFYWIALLVKLGLPLSFMTLKLGMCIVSTLSIPVFYALGRRVTGSKWVGLFTALVVALMPWHIQITRIGLRIAFSPLFAALTLLATYRALDTGRRNDWLLAGACLGLGMYGYTGFRLMAAAMPMIVVLKVLHDIWYRRHTGTWRQAIPRQLVEHLLAAAAVAVLVATPLIRYAIDQPAAFWGRTMSRMTGTEQPLAHPALEQFRINMVQALLMFNRTFDHAWFHSPGERPALETFGGALLILGLVVALAKASEGRWREAMLIPVIPIMLIPSVMALAFPIEVPHLSRAAGAIPAVAVLVVLPLAWFGEQWRKALGGLGVLVGAVLVAGLFWGMAQTTYLRYFVEYRESYNSATHRVSEAAKVAQGFIDMGGDIDHLYNIGWSNGWDYRAIGLTLGAPHWEGNLWGAKPDGTDAVTAADGQVGKPGRKLYLVGGPDAIKNVAYLRQLFPGSMATHHPVPGDRKDFWSVFVPESSEGAEPPAGK